MVEKPARHPFPPRAGKKEILEILSINELAGRPADPPPVFVPGVAIAVLDRRTGKIRVLFLPPRHKNLIPAIGPDYSPSKALCGFAGSGVSPARDDASVNRQFRLTWSRPESSAPFPLFLSDGLAMLRQFALYANTSHRIKNPSG